MPTHVYMYIYVGSDPLVHLDRKDIEETYINYCYKKKYIDMEDEKT